MQVDDWLAKRTVTLADGGSDLFCLVGRVVENLNLEQITRVVEVGAGFDQAVNDKLLIKNRQLDGDARKLLEMAGRFLGGVLPVFVIEINELVAMQAVEGQNDHHDEIRDEQRGVEPVPAVEMLEGVVSIVVAEIVAKIMFRLENRKGSDVKAKRAFEKKRFQQSRASRD